jgi:hypothetical protein
MSFNIFLGLASYTSDGKRAKRLGSATPSTERILTPCAHTRVHTLALSHTHTVTHAHLGTPLVDTV